jgi:aspartyl-tRNA(Asn)/glutamyl-tRNA(Gln) amidotransferase subunit C
MTLSIEETRRIAALARLRLSDAEERLFAAQLGKVVDYIDQLRDQRWEEPAGDGPSTPEAADRVGGESLPREVVLDNAPARRDGFVVVPAVIGSGDE